MATNHQPPNGETIAYVRCSTSTGPVVLELHRDWSPLGYDRAVELFRRGFYDNTHFFRAVSNFLVQFGISYTNDADLKRLGNSPIPDDPSKGIGFEEGTISYAGSGPNSRTSQLFIAYGKIPSLGTELWETPIGIVSEGIQNVRSFYTGYGDMPPWGSGPEQPKIHAMGRRYIDTEFPLLSYFNTCEVEVKGEKTIIEEQHQHQVVKEKQQQVKLEEVGVNSKIRIGDAAAGSSDKVAPLLFLSLVIFAILFGYSLYKRNKRRSTKTN